MPKKRPLKQKEETQETVEVENPYKLSWFDKVPFALKAIVLKYWFFGMEYFFFIMGITTFGSITDNLVLFLVEFLVLGLAGGLITDFMVDNILLVWESSKHEAKWWMIYKDKKSFSVFANVPYGVLHAYLSLLACRYITVGLTGAFGDGLDWVTNEPFTFALVALVIDLAFIGIKDIIMALALRNRKPEPEKDPNKAAADYRDIRKGE